MKNMPLALILTLAVSLSLPTASLCDTAGTGTVVSEPSGIPGVPVIPGQSLPDGSMRGPAGNQQPGRSRVWSTAGSPSGGPPPAAPSAGQANQGVACGNEQGTSCNGIPNNLAVIVDQRDRSGSRDSGRGR